jgi:MFS superfamily sulfate permease-like transporter
VHSGVSALIGLIDVHAFYHLWKMDKLDALVSLRAYLGVVVASVQVRLAIAVAISMVRVILRATRPHIAVLGNTPNTTVYRSTEQYTDVTRIPGILILRVEAQIYFTNASYLRRRIIR